MNYYIYFSIKSLQNKKFIMNLKRDSIQYIPLNIYIYIYKYIIGTKRSKKN